MCVWCVVGGKVVGGGKRYELVPRYSADCTVKYLYPCEKALRRSN